MSLLSFENGEKIKISFSASTVPQVAQAYEQLLQIFLQT